MARPRDWTPLREGDPVPGDPDGVRRQVKHMKKIAEYLRTQAASLAAMADADNLKGKYAEKLSEDARGLGRKLDLAEDRYREVKGHLGGWAEDLEEFQKRADRALRDAREAQRTIDSHESRADDPPRPSTDKPAEKPADTPKEDPRLKQAKEDLQDARTRLDSAESDYQERASHYARKIRSSIDDDMKDSWWNDFKAWVADAEWLSKFAEIASWACTVLSVVAIFFPPVGGIVAALTVATILINALQAATGNGSWLNVAMDLGALKLARVGGKAAKAITGLQKKSRNTAADLAKERAAGAASDANKGARQAAARGERKRGGTSGKQRAKDRARRLRMEEKNRRAGKNAANDVKEADLPEVTRKEGLETLGDKALGRRLKDIKGMRDTHPGNAELAENAQKARHYSRVNQGAWAASAGLDLSDKTLEGATDSYPGAKEAATSPVPGTSQW
ncbi:putative T7SS-secreted protein [Streptomyces sp. YIM 103828]|uniref:putative T7SS-secreted protein n=1 Tax=Streptomyces sp. YIM 103828 TaxID=3158968 RepID=UPI0032D9AA30